MSVHYCKANILTSFICTIVFYLVLPSSAFAGSSTSLSQYGITWTFATSRETGQYANGDYWVVGPVTITSITPDADVKRISNDISGSICTGNTAGANACTSWCTANAPAGYTSQCSGPARGAGICSCESIRHGWEVNPMPGGTQGFDNRASLPDAKKVPSLPYIAQPGSSILKAISRNPDSSNCNADDKNNITCLRTAAVLTVLAAAPTGGGSKQFRPPYVGTFKPVYNITQLRPDLLPSLSPVADAPALTWVYDRFNKVQLDHLPGVTGRATHPIEHMPDYGGEIGAHNGDGALRLMLNEPLDLNNPNDPKAKGLIAFVQYGIDLYHMALNGQVWPGGGGYRPGQRLPIAFAATILNDAAFKSTSKDFTFLDEDQAVFTGTKGVPLFGFWKARNEKSYWGVVVDYDAGNRTLPDPYGYIDGGHFPGSGYQNCCISQPFKGSLLARELMPAMREAWPDQEIQDYVDRWVTFGEWASPDPCAPADGVCKGGTAPGARCTTATGNAPCGTGGTCDLLAHWTSSTESHYGITYGPDGHGGCILDTDPSDGIGRFPQLHGKSPDAGLHYTRFQRAMWRAYRKVLVVSAHPQDATVNVGARATFQVAVVGSPTLTYQWLRNDQEISGATASTFTTPPLTLADHGKKYSCRVTSSFGSVTSNSAILKVSGGGALPPQAPINLKVR